jgi:Amt family ammonium transporter
MDIAAGLALSLLVFSQTALTARDGTGGCLHLSWRCRKGVSGLLYGDSKQFMLQLGGATICALWAFGVTFVVFKIVNAVKSIRVSAAVELAGLDEPEYGLLAYPEDAVVSMEEA